MKETEIKVLELYDMLEKLLIERDEERIFVANKTISDAIVNAINNLYEAGIEKGKEIIVNDITSGLIDIQGIGKNK